MDFLKRLASHVGALLVPNIVSHHAQIWIGIPQGRQHIQLKEVPFTLQRKIAPYLDQEANGWKSATIGDYTRYIFEWDQMLQLGDEVERNHETYVITKREGQLIRGLMTWSYECALSAGLKVPKIYNRTIIGAAIEGKILEVSRNQVRLHLDMDNQQNPKDAQWFPYSAEGNQVWYLMPEKGAQVKLYFPSADEDDAMVIQSVRTKPSSVAVPPSHAAQDAVVESSADRHQRKTADPGVKSFANPQGKEISLGNSELSMSAQEGSLYISMNTHNGVSLNSTQRIQIQATGSLNLSAGSILLQGTNGLHLNTTTDTLDLEKEVNSVSSEIQLKASLHQYYPEPILSDFEKQVAENGIQSVLGARVKENVGATLKGEWDAGIEFLGGVWDSVVDIADMGTMVMTPFVMPGNYTGKGFLERNETLEGIKGGAKFGWNYIADSFQGKKTKKDVVHDLETVWDGIKSIPDPIERKLNNFFPNPLTDTKQESYDAGYDSIKAVERVADIYASVKGGAKLVRNLGKLGKEEASLSKGLKEAEEKKTGKGGTPGLFGDSAKADSALAKIRDGKFKTNAIRFPTNFESLGSYLQSVARKMNIRITKRLPIFETAGGHYRFHDPGPDVPHSKGSGVKISPERQKQIDALESGEYTGKSTKGPEKEPNVSYGKVYPTRTIDLKTEGHIIDRVRDLRTRLSNRLKKDGNFAYSEVDIPGIDKKEFYAHSGLNGDNKAKDYADFSLKPTKKPKYEATKAPDKSGRIYKRDMDTEYKILNDLAARLDKLKDSSNVRGKIKMFTEKDTCGSCSRIINQFHKDYPGINIEIIHNNDDMIIP